MGWIKDSFGFITSKKINKSYIDFEEYNSLLVLKRIRVISIATVCMALFFCIMIW